VVPHAWGLTEPEPAQTTVSVGTIRKVTVTLLFPSSVTWAEGETDASSQPDAAWGASVTVVLEGYFPSGPGCTSRDTVPRPATFTVRAKPGGGCGAGVVAPEAGTEVGAAADEGAVDSAGPGAGDVEGEGGDVISGTVVVVVVVVLVVTAGTGEEGGVLVDGAEAGAGWAGVLVEGLVGAGIGTPTGAGAEAEAGTGA
jgi:hypothetical protein